MKIIVSIIITTGIIFMFFLILERKYENGFRDGVIHQQEIELKYAKERVRQNRIDSIQRVTPKSRIIYDNRNEDQY